jgi:hypothetical protein
VRLGLIQLLGVHLRDSRRGLGLVRPLLPGADQFQRAAEDAA